MQVVQTAVVPARTGKVILANIGYIRNSRAALTNRVREKIATDSERRREATAECLVPVLSGSLRSTSTGTQSLLPERDSRATCVPYFFWYDVDFLRL
jgi:hypothetical protein